MRRGKLFSQWLCCQVGSHLLHAAIDNHKSIKMKRKQNFNSPVTLATFLGFKSHKWLVVIE